MENKKRKEKSKENGEKPDVEKNEDLNAPENFLKHPLEHTWSIWLYTNASANWKKNLVKLTSFDTVEDFWCLHHYMKTPAELTIGQDYAIFKEGVRPMWEDRANEFGGRWLISLPSAEVINSYWLDVVLLMIGENFQNNSEICGAVVNVRNKSKLGIWTATTKNRKENEEIGQKIKSVLGLKCDIVFQVHNKNRNLYYV